MSNDYKKGFEDAIDLVAEWLKENRYVIISDTSTNGINTIKKLKKLKERLKC